MPWVAVFDTNVLISARLSLHGSPARCLELARAGRVESLSCEQILAEFEEKLITKFHRGRTESRAAADEIRRFSRIVQITGTLRAVPNDPDDDMIIECAVVGGATHIVTGDKRHLLPLGNYQGIKVVSAAAFVALVAVS